MLQTPTEPSVYQSVIYDEFDDYDTSIWQKADWNNGDPFYNAWCPDQVSFSGNKMILKLEQKVCHAKTHASGEYRTLSSYGHGRYTVRMQASDVNGTISSMFTYTGSFEGTEHDEIDIEILGKDPTKLQLNYWRNGHEHPHTVELGFDASEAMHTYTFEWTPDSITWYVDGVLVHSVSENGLSNNDSLPINAGKIMMNLWAAIGVESWSGAYTDGTEANASYEFVQYEELQ